MFENKTVITLIISFFVAFVEMRNIKRAALDAGYIEPLGTYRFDNKFQTASKYDREEEVDVDMVTDQSNTENVLLYTGLLPIIQGESRSTRRVHHHRANTNRRPYLPVRVVDDDYERDQQYEDTSRKKTRALIPVTTIADRYTTEANESEESYRPNYRRHVGGFGVGTGIAGGGAGHGFYAAGRIDR